MHIRIDEKDYTGTAMGILDQLRLEANQNIPTVAGYINFVQDNVRRMTDQPCDLKGMDTPTRASALIHRLEELGALEILEA